MLCNLGEHCHFSLEVFRQFRDNFQFDSATFNHSHSCTRCIVPTLLHTFHRFNFHENVSIKNASANSRNAVLCCRPSSIPSVRRRVFVSSRTCMKYVSSHSTINVDLLPRKQKLASYSRSHSSSRVSHFPIHKSTQADAISIQRK